MTTAYAWTGISGVVLDREKKWIQTFLSAKHLERVVHAFITPYYDALSAGIDKKKSPWRPSSLRRIQQLSDTEQAKLIRPLLALP